ncbi:uncharacterized protein [Physcomitrium patens]|uniref:uncharacterized protein n=1 Tax=Physcomitrium patens TaxID=3218 RepID=UPI003CCD2E4F
MAAPTAKGGGTVPRDEHHYCEALGRGGGGGGTKPRSLQQTTKSLPRFLVDATLGLKQIHHDLHTSLIPVGVFFGMAGA